MLYSKCVKTFGTLAYSLRSLETLPQIPFHCDLQALATSDAPRRSTRSHYKMRLRLSIQRNELPTVNILWSVSEVQLKHTIAQLLQQVNGAFPLETEHWGYEDYAVSIGGFECLHYNEVSSVCKDEDVVTIRPLQYAEIRARTITGRDQIAPDGRHLLDGVAFGRPQLKRPTRPQVRIPPRKRLKLSAEGSEDVEQEPQFLLENGAVEELEDEYDEDDEEDEDFDMDEEADVDSPTSEVDEEEDDDTSADTDSDDGSTSSSSSESASDSESDSSSSGESWDGIPSTPKRKEAGKVELNSSAGSSSVSDSSAEDDSSADADSTSDEGLGSVEKALPDFVQAYKNEALPNNNAPKGSGKRTTKLRNERRRDTKKLRYLVKSGRLPQGTTLLAFKEMPDEKKRVILDQEQSVQSSRAGDMDVDTAAHLPASVGAEDTSRDTSNTFGRSPPDDEGRVAKETLEIQRQKLLAQIAAGGIDVTAEDDDNGPPDELSSKSKPASPRLYENLNDIADSALRNKVERISNALQGRTIIEYLGALNRNNEDEQEALAWLYEQNDPMDVEQETPKASGSTDKHLGVDDSQDQIKDVVDPDMASAETTLPSASSSTRRAKLDVAGSKRLLLGSLGVRVPKNQEEREKLQKKLADKAKRPILPTGAVRPSSTAGQESPFSTVPEQQEVDDTPWRSKIMLTAVECCEVGVALSTPPFPFYQRWDVQQQRKRKDRNMAAYAAPKKRRKNGRAEAEYVETYDKYNTDGNGDALNYDDAEEDDEYWEEGALLDGIEDYDDDEEWDATTDDPAGQQLLQETVSQELENDLPALPQDLSTLPLLAQNEIHVNDIITFSRLEASAATGWQPAVSPVRTAIVKAIDASNFLELELAKRDLPQKEYNNEGKRMYRKFEMEDVDEPVIEVSWDELVEPKLLQRGTGAVNEAVAEDSGDSAAQEQV